MEVNKIGFAGGAEQAQASAGKKAAKVAAGAVAVAGAAVGAFYALKKGGLDVFEGISKQEGKNVFQKTFNAVKNGENWEKLGKAFRKGAVAIKDTVVDFAKKLLPKTEKAAENVTQEAA